MTNNIKTTKKTELKTINILVIDDKWHLLNEHLRHALPAGYQCKINHIESFDNFSKLLHWNDCDLIISLGCAESSVSYKSIIHCQKTQPTTPFFIVENTHHTDMEIRRLNLMELGAFDAVHIESKKLLSLTLKKVIQHSEILQGHFQFKNALTQIATTNDFLIASNPTPIILVDQGIVIEANQAYANLLGESNIEKTLWTPFMDIISKKSTHKIKSLLTDFSSTIQEKEIICQLELSSERSESWKLCFINNKHNDTNCVQILFQQHIQEKPNQPKPEKDSLTGLLQREIFIKILEKEISESALQPISSHVIFIKLDNFENTILDIGLAASDKVIYELAILLKSTLANQTSISRFSEQVFAILVRDNEQSEVMKIADKITNDFSTHATMVENLSVSITCSVGVCKVEHQVRNAYQLMAKAHSAYHIALANGGNQTCFYEPLKLASQHNKNHDLIDQIEYALTWELFEVAFDKIIGLTNEGEIMYQAIANFSGQESQKFNPQKIESLENNPFTSHSLDKLVLTKALKQITHEKDFKKDSKLFIYLTSASICDRSFCVWLKNTLSQMDTMHSQLIFEISSNTFQTHPHHCKRFCEEIKYMGSQIALSDFTLENDLTRQCITFPCDIIIFNNDFQKQLFKNCQFLDKLTTTVRDFHQHNKSVIIPNVEFNYDLTTLWDAKIDFIQWSSPQLESTFEALEMRLL